MKALIIGLMILQVILLIIGCIINSPFSIIINSFFLGVNALNLYINRKYL